MTIKTKSKSKKKRVVVQIRLTEEEKIKLFELAKEAGMNVSDFLRYCGFNKTPRHRKATLDREILIKLAAELGKIGSNINQIAKVMNTDQKTFYTVRVKEILIVKALEAVITLSTETLKRLNHGGEGEDTGQWEPVGILPFEEG